MSLYAELVRNAADRYRAQLDALYVRQPLIHRADQIVTLLTKAGLHARAHADEHFIPYITLRLSEELQPLQSTVLAYVCNVLECRLRDDPEPAATDRYQILPTDNGEELPSMLLLVEPA
ncbi:hypothetical protein DK842_14115 [Chromobacterium phragmitis]|uniref:Uncharacterized protein n=1 Tax=Chromobacterium phragmitis TaxID=2202141 RepID=A0A344UM19_9NEIS|nr:hypothetical protein [Chromobacterium phragmitis]AXE30920.1 hypothetical protein DK842_14115 [Chromobacterium phragmitis]AXE36317.1 hypothetical protein DK843_19685 [Chromobacterium phragmitis]